MNRSGGWRNTWEGGHWEARHWAMRAKCLIIAKLALRSRIQRRVQPGTAGAWMSTTRDFKVPKPPESPPAQIPGLKLKWAFGFPLGVSAFGQPSVAAGRVFVGSDIGYVYSLDMRTGCVYWSYKTNAAVRTAITIGPTGSGKSSRYAVYLGDMQANVYALDAASGQLLWTKRVEDHFSARITAAPTLYEGRLYVPVSTSEGFSASTLDYPCCTFRGSVVALERRDRRSDLEGLHDSGAQADQEELHRHATLGAIRRRGVEFADRRCQAPDAIYFGTGDSATEPAPDTSDSILAVDMDTGKVRWHFQAEPNDATLGGCFGKKTENCPDNPGPDWDFGASPILEDASQRPRSSAGAQQERHRVCSRSRIARAPSCGKRTLAEKQGTRNTNLFGAARRTSRISMWDW